MDQAKDIILLVLLGWLSLAGSAAVALLWQMSNKQVAHTVEIKALRDGQARHSEKISALERARFGKA